MYLKQATLTTAISLLSLAISPQQAKGVSLSIMNDMPFKEEIEKVGFIPEKDIDQQQSRKLGLGRKYHQVIQLLKRAESLFRTQELSGQIIKENTFVNRNQQKSSFSKIITTTQITASNESVASRLPEATEINQNIDERYHGLVETDQEKINLFETNKITKELITDDAETSQENKAQVSNPENKVITLLEDEESADRTGINYLWLLYLSGGILSTVLLAKLIFKFDFLALLSGKEKLPKEALELHNKTFSKVSSLGRKVEKLDNEKFTDQEFILYLKLKNKIEKGYKDRDQMCLSIKYLEVGILAQSSFLKLEQTELRYRSRKQQEFYNYIAENISGEIDKNEFNDLVKRKLSEVIPLINSQEGRDALQSYLKEVNKISQYDLGLKLLSLFKKFQLSDYTVLRKISDLVDKGSANNLLISETLNLLVLENFDVFQKIAPLIELNLDDSSTDFFAKVLQYLGLERRHQKSYQEFEVLLKTINKWLPHYNTLVAIRQEYSNQNHALSSQFSTDIPGLNVYKKYEENL